MKSISHTTVNWTDLIKLTLPIAMGYYAAGIAYGILGVNAGLPAWLVIALSVLVYSGAAQYAAIPLFASAAGFLPLVVGTLLISLRQIFYSLAQHQDLPPNGLKRWYATASITDESYALMSTQDSANRAEKMVRINFLCQFYWVSATIIGVLLGNEFSNAIPHLAFALPCLFIILAYEQYCRIRKLFPLLMALTAFIIAKIFMPSWVMLAAILLCIFFILAQHKRKLMLQIQGENHAE